MSFFKDFKADFAQAVNELMPDSNEMYEDETAGDIISNDNISEYGMIDDADKISDKKADGSKAVPKKTSKKSSSKKKNSKQSKGLLPDDLLRDIELDEQLNDLDDIAPEDMLDHIDDLLDNELYKDNNSEFMFDDEMEVNTMDTSVDDLLKQLGGGDFSGASVENIEQEERTVIENEDLNSALIDEINASENADINSDYTDMLPENANVVSDDNTVENTSDESESKEFDDSFEKYALSDDVSDTEINNEETINNEMINASSDDDLTLDNLSLDDLPEPDMPADYSDDDLSVDNLEEYDSAQDDDFIHDDSINLDQAEIEEENQVHEESEPDESVQDDELQNHLEQDDLEHEDVIDDISSESDFPNIIDEGENEILNDEELIGEDVSLDGDVNNSSETADSETDNSMEVNSMEISKEENIESNAELNTESNTEEHSTDTRTQENNSNDKVKYNPGDIDSETTYITKGTTISGDIETDGSIDIIGVVNGNVTSKGKVVVGGTVNGNIIAGEIYANGAKIEGDIKSYSSVKVGVGTMIVGSIEGESAVIAGAVNGELDVKGPVIVDSTAVIMGNIKSRSVQINNGAVIEGFCSQSYSDIDVKSFFA